MSENEVIKGRLVSLRAAMKENGIDYYMMPTSDFHNSEYSADFFKVREYFCGFDGSNGTLVVSADEAGLWTDGRYFIQAGNQLAGTGVELYKMGNPGVPTIDEYLARLEHLGTESEEEAISKQSETDSSPTNGKLSVKISSPLFLQNSTAFLPTGRTQ